MAKIIILLHELKEDVADAILCFYVELLFLHDIEEDCTRRLIRSQRRDSSGSSNLLADLYCSNLSCIKL